MHIHVTRPCYTSVPAEKNLPLKSDAHCQGWRHQKSRNHLTSASIRSVKLEAIQSKPWNKNRFNCMQEHRRIEHLVSLGFAMNVFLAPVSCQLKKRQLSWPKALLKMTLSLANRRHANRRNRRLSLKTRCECDNSSLSTSDNNWQQLFRNINNC